MLSELNINPKNIYLLLIQYLLSFLYASHWYNRHNRMTHDKQFRAHFSPLSSERASTVATSFYRQTEGIGGAYACLKSARAYTAKCFPIVVNTINSQMFADCVSVWCMKWLSMTMDVGNKKLLWSSISKLITLRRYLEEYGMTYLCFNLLHSRFPSSSIRVVLQSIHYVRTYTYLKWTYVPTYVLKYLVNCSIPKRSRKKGRVMIG